jgi:hypothetical protein
MALLTPQPVDQTLFQVLAERAWPVQKRQPLPADPWEFAVKCCVTIDEERAGSGEVMRPFPQYEYLRHLIETVAAHPFVWIVKSGQLTVSWALQAYFLHQMLTKPGYRFAYYCQTMLKAERHVESRFWRLYRNIPAQYARPFAAHKAGGITVSHDGANRPPTAWTVPQASEEGAADSETADKMRSETWTRALIDEGGFYPNLSALVGSLRPRCQGGIVLPSTPDGPGDFQRIGLGNIHDPKERCVGTRAADCRDALGAVELCKGVLRWERNGYVCLDIGYEAHPERDPATERGRVWITANRNITDSQWKREQERSFDVSARSPVLECAPRLVDGKPTGGLLVRPQAYRRATALLRGYDFGYLWAVALFAQVKTDYDPATGKELRQRLCFIRELVLQEKYTDDLAKETLGFTATMFPGTTMVRDACDFYGGNQQTSRNPKTDVEILNSHGIYPVSKAAQIKHGIEMWQWLINHGLCEVDPACELLLTAMRSGYVRDDNGEIPSEAKKPRPWADIIDAGRYIIENFFGFENPDQTGAVVYRPSQLTTSAVVSGVTGQQGREQGNALHLGADGVDRRNRSAVQGAADDVYRPHQRQR